MILVFAEGFRWSAVCEGLIFAYDLTLGCPPAQVEALVEPGLMAGELGGHAAGFGPASGGRVDQHGLADGGELAEQFPDGHVQAVLAGGGAREGGALEGHGAGEGVIAVISASTFSRGGRVRPRARVAASSPSFLPALARVVPSNPRAWLSRSSGEWVRMARRSAP